VRERQPREVADAIEAHYRPRFAGDALPEGHAACALALADKLERGVPFSPSDTEPEDVDWINDASRPLIHAIPPREVARLALRIAEETDARVANLPVDRLSPRDPDSPLYALRASHRGEHLDDVDSALRATSG